MHITSALLLAASLVSASALPWSSSSSKLETRDNDKAKPFSFTAASWNLRYGNPDDITLSQSLSNLSKYNPLDLPQDYYSDMRERPWSERRIPLAGEMLWNDISLAGMQEVLFNQLEDMDALLQKTHPDFEHRGVGRGDGCEDDSCPPVEGLNEFSPVYFRNSMFDLKEWDTFWLSYTPFEISQHPNTTNWRICTTARFDTPAGDVTVMATHWDHQSNPARAQAASLILHRAKSIVEQTGRPVLLFGDMNSPTFGEDSAGYKIITGQQAPEEINSTFAEKYPVKSNKPFSFKDTITATPKERVTGHSATFTGFGDVQNSTEVNEDYSQIDFIFGSSAGGWESKAHKVGSNFFDDGLIFSDHRPVMAQIELKPGQFYL